MVQIIKMRRWYLGCFVKTQKRNLMFLMKKHVFSIHIGQMIFWNSISEMDPFWEIWVKMLDRKPKSVSEKQWKIVTFGAIFCPKPPFGTLWDYCLWSVGGSRKEAFLMKKSENWWKMSDFLSLFCEILPTNLEFIFFAIFPHLISDIIAFMCENRVFLCVFMHFTCILGD